MALKMREWFVSKPALYIGLLSLGVALTSPSHAFETSAKQAVVYDAASGMTLYSKAAEERMYPSSMSKLMTLYVLFQKIQDGVYSLDDTFPVSEKAWRKGGSKMFVEIGKEIKIEDLIRGIIVQSGNDACIVVSEAISGSEEAFAELMTNVGKNIGLQGSHFTNATGWPDEKHYMTTVDLLMLSKRLVEDFPNFYHYFAEDEFTYGGIRQPNRNPLLSSNLGVDGLKTGHTEIAGYGIALSALDEESDRRIYAVINGLESEADRKAQGRHVLQYALREYGLATLSSNSDIYGEFPVFMGKENTVPAVPQNTMISLPKSDRDQIRLSIKHNAAVPAPIVKGDTIAELIVHLPGNAPHSVPLIATRDVEKAGFLGRAFQALRHLIAG